MADGEAEDAESVEAAAVNMNSRSARWRSDPVDEEVLDDRELYQFLLKEFVETGSAGVQICFLCDIV